MRIIYTTKFQREYKKLPPSIKEQAKLQVAVFEKDPFDPKLKTHKLHGHFSEFWSFSITHKHRLVFEFSDEGVYFHAIGDHDVYS